MTMLTGQREEQRAPAIGVRHAQPGRFAPNDTYISPTTTAPSSFPSASGGNAASLEQKSPLAVLGPEGLKRSSVVQITTPHGNTRDTELPRISAPPQDTKDANPTGLKLVWQRLMEMTPGTNAHKREYGTRFALGTYRMTYGKRGSYPS